MRKYWIIAIASLFCVHLTHVLAGEKQPNMFFVSDTHMQQKSKTFLSMRGTSQKDPFLQRKIALEKRMLADKASPKNQANIHIIDSLAKLQISSTPRVSTIVPLEKLQHRQQMRFQDVSQKPTRHHMEIKQIVEHQKHYEAHIVNSYQRPASELPQISVVIINETPTFLPISASVAPPMAAPMPLQ